MLDAIAAFVIGGLIWVAYQIENPDVVCRYNGHGASCSW